MKTLNISQKLKRDHCTFKRFVADSQHTGFVQIKAPGQRFLSDIHWIKTAAANRPLRKQQTNI